MKRTRAELESWKYPIGRFEEPPEINPARIADWIRILEELPGRFREEVESLNDQQLDQPYRPGGWSIRQLIHHVADSHQHSYIRFKWALTEDNPVIKAYDQEAWSALPDARSAPVELSLSHLEAAHARLVYLLWGFGEAEWSRTFTHPETGQVSRLDVNLARYAWHGAHHLAQLERARMHYGW